MIDVKCTNCIKHVSWKVIHKCRISFYYILWTTFINLVSSLYMLSIIAVRAMGSISRNWKPQLEFVIVFVTQCKSYRSLEFSEGSSASVGSSVAFCGTERTSVVSFVKYPLMSWKIHTAFHHYSYNKNSQRTALRAVCSSYELPLALRAVWYLRI